MTASVFNKEIISKYYNNFSLAHFFLMVSKTETLLALPRLYLL
jgi:hypothetical protein